MASSNLLKSFAIVFCIAGAPAARANILPNPQFHQGIAGWTVLSGSAQVTLDTSLGFGDTLSLRAVLPSGGQATIGSACLPANGLGDVRGSAEAFPVAPGTVCLAYPMFYENAGCTGNFNLIGTGDSWPASPPGQWTEQSSTIARPQAFQSIRLALYISSQPDSGCNFDSVALAAPAPPTVPTLRAWGIALLVLMLAFAGLSRVSR